MTQNQNDVRSESLDSEEIICENCNKSFKLEEKDYVYTPIGFVRPGTDVFVDTKKWCLRCCIKVERGEI